MVSIVNEWLKTSSAQKFFEHEKQSFQRISQSLSGQLGIQLSLVEQHNYITEVNLSSEFHVFQDISTMSTRMPANPNSQNTSVYAQIEALPFSSNQFAVVIVPQMKLFCSDPYAALREVYRITASDGYVVISGINQWSLMGLQAKCFPKKYPLVPTVSLNQMKVWLSLLGCDVVAGDLFHYSAMQNRKSYPAIASNVEKMGNRWFPMLAGGYWLVARKRLFGHIGRGSTSSQRYKAGKIAGQIANKL